MCRVFTVSTLGSSLPLASFQSSESTEETASPDSHTHSHTLRGREHGSLGSAGHDSNAPAPPEGGG